MPRNEVRDDLLRFLGIKNLGAKMGSKSYHFELRLFQAGNSETGFAVNRLDVFCYHNSEQVKPVPWF